MSSVSNNTFIFSKKTLDHNKVHIHKKFQDLSRCQPEHCRYSMSLKKTGANGFKIFQLSRPGLYSLT